MLDLPGLGLKQVLVIPNNKANKASFICNFSTFNLVTFTDVKTIGIRGEIDLGRHWHTFPRRLG